jgi:hypothetical protein
VVGTAGRKARKKCCADCDRTHLALPVVPIRPNESVMLAMRSAGQETTRINLPQMQFSSLTKSSH